MSSIAPLSRLAGLARVLLAAGSLAVASPVLSAREDPEPGISLGLAQDRARRVEQVSYDLRFQIEAGEPQLGGAAAVHFRVREGGADVLLDFGGLSLDELVLDGRARPELRWLNGHLVLPAADMRPGPHVLQARFTAAVAPTGAPLTVYRDEASGREYLYTLLVPADAHRLFPCFDQPDLKACYRLALDLPEEWIGVANAAEQSVVPAAEGRRRWRFAPTEPISSYLFAFAAGPFERHEIEPADGSPPLRVLARPEKRDELDLPALASLHRRSLRWLEDYFDVPYPFGKLDVVLCPGFPYGGMEHPGAIFYRETALAFDHAPSRSELTRRSTLVYHEVSHQWFGNLVTMRWFDDLWLKEGFATFMGYSALDELEPEQDAWLRFHQRVKPAAYRVDATAGTTPVYQPLGDLFDAKSNYGPIVYNKAPAILRELEARLGREPFRAGVTTFLTRYARGNASWRELIACLEERSGEDLSRWADRWINTPGLPTVQADWELDDAGRIQRFELRQSSSTEAQTWPLNVSLLIAEADGSRRELRLGLLNERTALPRLVGQPAPRWVLLNPRDVEYGQFLLDPRSTEALLQDLPDEADVLVRSTGFAALWETVREARLDPARFLQQTALPMLAAERDALTHGRFLGAIAVALDRYLGPERAAPLRGRLVEILRQQLESGQVPGQEIGIFRRLCEMSEEPAIAELLTALLSGDRELPGLELGIEDRFRAAGALLATGRPDGLAWLSRLEEEASSDVARSVFVARAALPTAENKAAYFERYLDPDDPPEQWITASLATFHAAGHEELCLPYLRPALDRVEWVKEHRKIFFMPAWLDAFVNAHASEEALATVQTFLGERPDLPEDIRKKLLQSLDGLERAVRIRRRFEGG